MPNHIYYVPAVLFVAVTGCRPSEAAYIVRANAIQPNTFPAFRPAVWAVEVPPEFNKTKKDYQWGVPPGMDEMVPLIKELH